MPNGVGQLFISHGSAFRGWGRTSTPHQCECSLASAGPGSGHALRCGPLTPRSSFGPRTWPLSAVPHPALPAAERVAARTSPSSASRSVSRSSSRTSRPNPALRRSRCRCRPNGAGRRPGLACRAPRRRARSAAPRVPLHPP